jgi:hypothetical protein
MSSHIGPGEDSGTSPEEQPGAEEGCGMSCGPYHQGHQGAATTPATKSQTDLAGDSLSRAQHVFTKYGHQEKQEKEPVSS